LLKFQLIIVFKYIFVYLFHNSPKERNTKLRKKVKQNIYLYEQIDISLSEQH